MGGGRRERWSDICRRVAFFGFRDVEGDQQSECTIIFFIHELILRVSPTGPPWNKIHRGPSLPMKTNPIPSGRRRAPVYCQKRGWFLASYLHETRTIIGFDYAGLIRNAARGHGTLRFRFAVRYTAHRAGTRYPVCVRKRCARNNGGARLPSLALKTENKTGRTATSGQLKRRYETYMHPSRTRHKITERWA